MEISHASAGKRTALSMLMVIVALVCGTSRAFASFGVYPSRIEVNSKQGDTAKFEINVSTDGMEYPAETVVSAWNFARDTKGEPSRVPPEDEAKFKGCASWLEWFPGSAVVEPDKERKFMFSVDVPKDANNGTHYCYVTFQGTPKLEAPGEAESGQAMRTPVSYAVSALVLVSVVDTSSGAPALDARANVKTFSVKPFNLEKSVPMETTIVNRGNVHLSMGENSRILITRGKYTEAEVPVQPYTLLPGNTLTIPATWKASAPFGIYKATFQANVGLDEPITSSQRFVVLPWPWLAGLSAGLLLLIAALVFFFRRFRIAPKVADEAATAASGERT